jgi:hypothetical protein
MQLLDKVNILTYSLSGSDSGVSRFEERAWWSTCLSLTPWSFKIPPRLADGMDRHELRAFLHWLSDQSRLVVMPMEEAAGAVPICMLTTFCLFLQLGGKTSWKLDDAEHNHGP